MRTRRTLADTKEKAQRIGIYEDGECILFVPTERLWEIHEAARGTPAGASLRQKRAAIEEKLDRPVPQWIFYRESPCRKHEWFLPWLLQGRTPPAKVYVASAGMVRHARLAWNYSAHCRAAGTTWDNYQHWLDEIAPRGSDHQGWSNWLGWLKWLYGDNPPDGYYVVRESMLNLRDARSPTAVRDRARVSKRTWQLWKKECPETLAAALAAASNGGNQASLAGNEGWEALGPRGKNSMWRYATASTYSACGRAVGLDESVFPKEREKARRFGAEEQLLAFLATEERGKGYRKTGLIGGKLFVPSRDMLLFRKAAKAAAASANIWGLRGLCQLPAFDEWFKDSILPRRIGHEPRRGDIPPNANGRGNGNGRPVETLEITRSDDANSLPLAQASPPSKPSWEGERRELRFGDRLLRTFGRQPSTNQLDLIEAFDREGWPPAIVDPFRDYERLKQTWKDLNRTLPPNTLRFGGDGTGEGVRWDWLGGNN
jgi:hypothetical protein